MTQKEEVRGSNAHPFYKWAKETYGSKSVPKWNFHKIVIDKNGKVFDTFCINDKSYIKKVYQIN